MKVRLGDYIKEYTVRNKSLEDIPVYSVTNREGFCTGYFDKDVASQERSTYKIVPKGCFAYNPSRINVGSVDWQRHLDRVIVSPLYVVFSVSPDLLPQYLFYFLKSDISLTFIRSAATGSVRDNLKFSMLQEFPIEIRTVEKQAEIVAILDKVKAICDLYQRKLDILDNLIKARFVEMSKNSITTPTRMGDVATYINGYAFKPTDWTTEGLPIIRIQNLNDREALYNHYSGTIDNKYQVHTGDILVSWATHLEAYLWQGGDAWLNQHIFRVIFDKMQINKIYYIYSTEDALRQAFKNAHGFKPTMEHIKRSDFEDAIILLPPIEVQNQFATFVTQVAKSKVVVQKALDEAKLLFDSLMQKYFC